MNSKYVIILPYIEAYTDEYIIDLCRGADCVICADGGQDIARRLNITPDVCIGDFDSTSITEHFECEYIRYPAEKDITDGEACLEYALGQGAKEIIFIGGIGGRLDHTLGALALLEEAAACDVSVELRDLKNRVTLLKPGVRAYIRRDDYKYFSIVPLDSEVSGVTISGAKYNIDKTDIRRASTLCISNEAAEDIVTIESQSGLAYLIQSGE